MIKSSKNEHYFWKRRIILRPKIVILGSVETLTWHEDTFFTGLLRENGVGVAYDKENSIFIDRDPDLFKEKSYFLETL